MNICPKCGHESDRHTIRLINHRKAMYCVECRAFISTVPNRTSDDFVLYFGKYKGRNIKSMLSNREEREYLIWIHGLETTKDWQRRIINQHLHL